MAEAVCRCICGTGRRDPLDQSTTWAPPDADLEDLDDSLFPIPNFTGRLSYSIYFDQPMRGQAMRQGELWFLSTQEKVDPVNFSLYINGFSYWHEGEEVSISLSPFSLVRNCKFQSTYPSLGSLSDFKIFKISLFAQGRCYYFGIKGENEHQAEEERSRWVLDISRAMRLVTQSLFPPYTISCDPLQSVASTHRRLMAGYLIHCDDGYVASILYCELHPHCEDKAKMVMYENEACQTPVMDVYITERSICCEKIGINCSSFSIEEHQFSTRSLSERKLWLRAISNLKVKLQNRAPTPTVLELRNYRHAIKEHIQTMQGSLDGQLCQTDALLQRCTNPGPAKMLSFAAPTAPFAVPVTTTTIPGGPGHTSYQTTVGQSQGYYQHYQTNSNKSGDANVGGASSPSQPEDPTCAGSTGGTHSGGSTGSTAVVTAAVTTASSIPYPSMQPASYAPQQPSSVPLQQHNHHHQQQQQSDSSAAQHGQWTDEYSQHHQQHENSQHLQQQQQQQQHQQQQQQQQQRANAAGHQSQPSASASPRSVSASSEGGTLPAPAPKASSRQPPLAVTGMRPAAAIPDGIPGGNGPRLPVIPDGEAPEPRQPGDG